MGAVIVIRIEIHSLFMRQGDKEIIVVVGGGFAGLNFVKKLDKRRFDVLLVDKNNYHSFPPLFYQVASAGLEPAGISFPLRRELNRKRSMRGARFCMADVSAVDVARKVVVTDCGELHYDRVVIAAGTTNNFFNMPQLEKTVYTLKSTSDAIRCRNDILALMERASQERDPGRRRRMLSFVVIGGGPAGVEVAGALGEMKKYIVNREYPELSRDDVTITLIEGSDRLLRAMSEKSSADAVRYLAGLMVDVRLNAVMADYSGDVVTLSDGQELEAGMVVWTAGVTGVPVEIRGAYIKLARGNRFEVDSHCKVKGTDNVYAIGDIASMSVPGYPDGHPQLAQVAIQQGRMLAGDFNRGSAADGFRYRDKGTMATVGRGRAVVDMEHLHLSGWVAWVAWMFIHLISLLGMRNKVSVLIDWTWAYFTYGSSLRLLLRQSRYPDRRPPATT